MWMTHKARMTYLVHLPWGPHVFYLQRFSIRLCVADLWE